MEMKCKGCKYLDFRLTLGHHICMRFKDRGGLVFGSASEAYNLGCKGKYKKQGA